MAHGLSYEKRHYEDVKHHNDSEQQLTHANHRLRMCMNEAITTCEMYEYDDYVFI